MATSTQYQPVTITRLDRDAWDAELVAEGQHVATGAYGFVREQLDHLPDEHPVVQAWEDLTDEVFGEIHSQIRDLFYDALSKRLPWTSGAK